ncbi:MAG TPA: hypothetical protein VFP36_10065, partial [Usitatibacter sp.]|nr:hypothetical protein [Usitatibacter sp.]
MNDKHTTQSGFMRRLAVGVLSLSLVGLGALAQGNPQAAAAAANRKVSPDLADVANGGNGLGARWVQDAPGGRMVDVIITVDPKGDA